METTLETSRKVAVVRQWFVRVMKGEIELLSHPYPTREKALVMFKLVSAKLHATQRVELWPPGAGRPERFFELSAVLVVLPRRPLAWARQLVRDDDVIEFEDEEVERRAQRFAASA